LWDGRWRLRRRVALARCYEWRQQEVVST